MPLEAPSPELAGAVVFGMPAKVLDSAPSPRRPARARWHRTRRLLLILAIAFLVRAFVSEASMVPTPSMEGTILVGDHLLLNKFLYGPRIPFTSWRLPTLAAPRRGDIVAFHSPVEPAATYLKRVVAVGGDTVEIRAGAVLVNGKRLSEPYLRAGHLRVVRHGDMLPRRVPSGHLFVMGDNRDNSNDSRDWGTVPVANVIGEPVFIYWSYDAPSAAWMADNFSQRLQFYLSIPANLLAKTRWSRTGTLL